MLGLSVYLAIWRRSKFWNSKTAKRAAGIRRVVAYAIAVTLVMGIIATKKAQADSAEAVKGLSRDLMSLQDVLGNGSELKINGETVHVASTSTKEGVKATLDRFAKHCDENPSAFGEAWAKLGLSEMNVDLSKLEDEAGSGASTMLSKAPGGQAGTIKMGTFRSGNDDEGVVLCLVRSEMGAKDVAVAFEEFSRTQDLGALGKMRYAYAKKNPSGTSLLTAWTDEHFSFKALSPDSSTVDAPGSDSVLVPRPEKSQRILSAEVQGTSYAVRIYSAPGTVASSINTYDGLMRDRGFQPIQGNNSDERGYLRGGLFITMLAQPTDKGVTLSFAELGSNTGAATGGATASRQ